MAHPLLDQATSTTVEAYRAYKVGDEPNDDWSLFVEFKSGSIYRYIVPWNVYLDMKSAPSLGKFINQMKPLYTGTVVQPQELEELVKASNAAATAAFAGAGKKQKKAPSKAFFARYPELAYFF